MTQETSADGAGESQVAAVRDDIVKRLIAFQRELRERDAGVARIRDVSGAVLEPVSGQRGPALELVDLTAAEADLAARIAAQELTARIAELEGVIARIDGLVAELRSRLAQTDPDVEGPLGSIEEALAAAAPEDPGV